MTKKTRQYFLLFIICVIGYVYGIQQPLSHAIIDAKKTLQSKQHTQHIAIPAVTQAALWPLLGNLHLQRLQTGEKKHFHGWVTTPLTCELRGSFAHMANLIDHSPLPIEHLAFTAQDNEIIATLTFITHKADDNID